VGNILLSRIMGAEIQLVDEGFDIGIRGSWTAALEDVKAKGGKPYAIPAGASVHKFGGLGYVGFAEEVRAQEKEMDVKFDFIVACTVTGSTHAGMVVGFAVDGRARNVIGIDASCTPMQTKAQVLDIAQKTSALVGGRDITADDIVLLEDYAYPVYGVPSKENSCGNTHVRTAGRDDHRPCLRGQVDAGNDRPRPKRVLPKKVEGALRASGRRSGAQRLQLHVSQRLTRLGRTRFAQPPRADVTPSVGWGYAKDRSGSNAVRQ